MAICSRKRRFQPLRAPTRSLVHPERQNARRGI
nr:MAG TPA: hypothetical protein [Caudoviricetes sp.]